MTTYNQLRERIAELCNLDANGLQEIATLSNLLCAISIKMDFAKTKELTLNSFGELFIGDTEFDLTLPLPQQPEETLRALNDLLAKE